MPRKSKQIVEGLPEVYHHDRYFVRPKDEAQRLLVNSIMNNSLTIVSGPAGSGKTLLCIQSMYTLLVSGKIDKIIVIRLITETCQESLGALPGEKDEKMLPFLMPIVDNLSVFLPQNEISRLVDKGLIEIIPVSHCRGRSFINCGIVIEEAQNLSAEMALTILTRIGLGSHMVFNGDEGQIDIRGRTGLTHLKDLCFGLSDCGVINLTYNQVYRHPLVKEILRRVEMTKEIAA